MFDSNFDSVLKSLSKQGTLNYMGPFDHPDLLFAFL